MQVGDMVELSAAGKKSQQNWAVVGKIGLVTEIGVTMGSHGYPYQVEWYGVKHNNSSTGIRNGILPMKRYEIKKLRKK